MFHCRSVSHHRTPLDIRERLSLTAPQQAQWLSQHHRSELAIVSTCNRLELYMHAPSPQHIDTLWSELLRQRQIEAADVAPYIVTLSGLEAVQHLFRVSCGLESMALGEPQILGQVTFAYQLSQEHKAIGASLSLLFRAAIHAAKRARTETAIGNGSASVSSLGIIRAEEKHGPLSERNILVLGAGEMGETIVKALSQRGAQQVTIVSRTFAPARKLADTWSVHARPVTDLKDALTQADVLFTTSSAPYTILGCEDVAPIMADRPERPLCIIDIAVPRDVDPAVVHIPGVCLHDVDDLQHVIEETLEERRANIPAVENIIDEEIDHFWADYQSRSVVPTIRKLREQAEALRQAELAWAYNRLSPDSDQARALIDQLSHRLMNKMLHHLTRNLRDKAAQEDGALVAEMARELFGLEDAV